MLLKMKETHMIKEWRLFASVLMACERTLGYLDVMPCLGMMVYVVARCCGGSDVRCDEDGAEKCASMGTLSDHRL